MSKTLVIILAETRAYELTFDKFKKNVIDENKNLGGRMIFVR